MTAKSRGSKTDRIPMCPKCGGQDIWRHGKNSAGTRQWLCRSCRRVFVAEPYLANDIRVIADRMIEAEIAIPKIADVLQGFVSRRWLYNRKGLLNV